MRFLTPATFPRGHTSVDEKSRYPLRHTVTHAFSPRRSHLCPLAQHTTTPSTAITPATHHPSPNAGVDYGSAVVHAYTSTTAIAKSCGPELTPDATTSIVQVPFFAFVTCTTSTLFVESSVKLPPAAPD